MKLYFSPGACSRSPHIALREAGLPFSLVQVNLKDKTCADGSDFLKVNPKGQVPLLELDNGAHLSEGAAILQYIADQVPEKNLAPANGSMERYRLQEWLNFIATEVHKNFSPLFKPNTPDDYKEIARGFLAMRLGFLDQHLATVPYATGESFSVADCYLFTALGWCGYVGVDLTPFANLRAYIERVGARPAVQEAIAAEQAT